MKSGFNTAVLVILCLFITSGLLASSSFGNNDLEAPRTISFMVTTGECCGGDDSDPHAVHGLETDDHAFILSGKIADSGGNHDGFVIRFPDFQEGDGILWLLPEEDFNYDWVYTYGLDGKNDGVNAAAEAYGSVFIAGYRSDNKGTAHAFLARLALSDGKEIWSTIFPAAKKGRESAFESLQLTSENGLVFSGVTNAEKGSLEGFKSYGNPATGSAFVMYFDQEQLIGNEPPKKPKWYTEFHDNLSGKTVREVPSQGGYIVASSTKDDTQTASVIMIDKGGKTSWSRNYPAHGEITDITVSRVNEEIDGYLIVGHAQGRVGALDGSITKLSTDGSIVWSKQYGNPVGGEGVFFDLNQDNDRFVFDECWGIDSTDDGGAVIACGTGTHCDEFENDEKLFAQCTTDPRETWRSLLFRVDRNGKEI